MKRRYIGKCLTDSAGHRDQSVQDREGETEGERERERERGRERESKQQEFQKKISE